jgi:hypothetical protein
MAGDHSAFSRLPKDVSEVLLLQAWQRLDQRHRFGIIPLVCSSWYHLSLPTFTSLELKLGSKKSIQQLSAWLGRHGSSLQHLSLIHPAAIKRGRELAQLVQRCTSLRSLHLLNWQKTCPVPELSRWTQLTSLQLCNSIVQLGQLQQLPPQLQSLDLSSSLLLSAGQEGVHHLLSCLPHLTSLDLRQNWISLEYLATCPSLPQLQELKLSSYLSSQGLLETLGRLPCTVLEVSFYDMEEAEQFVTWSAGNLGKQCLGKVTSLSCSLSLSRGTWSGSFKSQALLPCLAGAATTLKHLELTDGSICSQNLSLLTGLTQLTSLHFEYAGPADADVVTPLAALSNLQHLTVAGLSEGQADAVRVSAAAGLFPSLKKLRSVTVSFGEIAGMYY